MTVPGGRPSRTSSVVTLKNAPTAFRARKRQADASPSGGEPPWPADRATALTLRVALLIYVMVMVPHVAVVVTAGLDGWFLYPVTGLALAAARLSVGAAQRLVRFMLTGEIQPIDRSRAWRLRGPPNRPGPAPGTPPTHPLQPPEEPRRAS